MTEVVDTGQQTQNKGDDDVEDDEEKVFDGGRTFCPVVQKVKEEDGYYAEKSARRSTTCR